MDKGMRIENILRRAGVASSRGYATALEAKHTSVCRDEFFKELFENLEKELSSTYKNKPLPNYVINELENLVERLFP